MYSGKDVMDRPADSVVTPEKSEHQKQWEREEYDNRPMWYDPRYDRHERNF